MEKARFHILKRIMGKVDQSDSGCWLWKGFRSYLGYGQITVQGKTWPAHRLTYTLFKGEIPEGMQACHTCDNPPCCNPDHIFLGTASDNSRDSQSKGRHYTSAKTECPRGHGYAEHGYTSKRGRRTCRICMRARMRIRAGWPEDLAYSVGVVPHGYSPVGAVWHTGTSRDRGLRNEHKTHCKHGHPLSGDNLYIVPKTGHRQCRACRHEVVKRIQAERLSDNG